MDMVKAMRRARKIRGYSQDRLASEANIGSSTLKFWEYGRTVPSAITLIRVCDVLECSVDEYLGRGLEDE